MSSCSILSSVFVNEERRVKDWKYYRNLSWSCILAMAASWQSDFFSHKFTRFYRKAFLTFSVSILDDATTHLATIHGGSANNIFILKVGKYMPVKLGLACLQSAVLGGRSPCSTGHLMRNSAAYWTSRTKPAGVPTPQYSWADELRWDGDGSRNRDITRKVVVSASSNFLSAKSQVHRATASRKTGARLM